MIVVLFLICLVVGGPGAVLALLVGYYTGKGAGRREIEEQAEEIIYAEGVEKGNSYTPLVIMFIALLPFFLAMALTDGKMLSGIFDWAEIFGKY
ncbi:MAG: hypothetical protein PVI38_07190 [Desulfobacterales bacterium]|jgi:hypothetical protein